MSTQKIERNFQEYKVLTPSPIYLNPSINSHIIKPEYRILWLVSPGAEEKAHLMMISHSHPNTKEKYPIKIT